MTRLFGRFALQCVFKSVLVLSIVSGFKNALQGEIHSQLQVLLGDKDGLIISETKEHNKLSQNTHN